MACLPDRLHPGEPARARRPDACEARPLVDLIFFPTGGGKTEAYLGASAISLLARRLRNPDDAGTDTLMRYTLRLLTAQQFLRASSLICVLEDMRSRIKDELGTAPFGIGVWLGGDSTPNTLEARPNGASRSCAAIPTRRTSSCCCKCPWCGTQMGTDPHVPKGQDTPGYVWSGNVRASAASTTPAASADARACRCTSSTRTSTKSRPSIVIGTVDKFAMMAWRPAARNLFGLGEDGERVCTRRPA